MSKNSKSSGGVLLSLMAPLTIILAFIVAYLIFTRVLGNPVNFEGGNPKGHPLQGNLLGMMYKGGVIVPVLITVIITLLTYVIERYITLTRVKGKSRLNVFVSNIQKMLAEDKIEEAIEACDKQKGSLANVMKAGLSRYRALENDKELEKDQKITSMKQAIEEATALELPVL
ncbi:MAG TPA: MotA/TolQ/ExbB proton channel family protein, partial [Tenuifilaceae bacterium]|nr:MotA/TolQ/ExbB proton channel family protein [Tenuifilaceae bacterium]